MCVFGNVIVGTRSPVPLELYSHDLLLLSLLLTTVIIATIKYEVRLIISVEYLFFNFKFIKF